MIREPLRAWRVPCSWNGGNAVFVVPARSAQEALERTQRTHKTTVALPLTFGTPYLPEPV